MKSLSAFVLATWFSILGAFLAAQEEASGSGIAFGLNGISDWSTQHPFLDIMKTARPWIGHLPNQWGGMDFDEMEAAGVFDESGWPLRIPDGVSRLESLILTDQLPDAVHLTGRYILTYDGDGDLDVTGSARLIKREPGLRVFNYSPGPGAVGISIGAINPANPIRNIRVISEKHHATYQEGSVFNPDWIDRLGDVEMVRFMDWMFTNGSPTVGWNDLPKESDFSYVWRGVPVSVMVDLANILETDPWFNMPHMADDDLVRRFAEQVKAELHPALAVYVEYSNEVWNFIFEQAIWAGQQAETLWGETNDGWMQYYGLRAATMQKIWTDVFGDETPDRLNRVFTAHTGWPELEQAALLGARAEEALGFKPVEMFDAYAVTGYFGSEIGEPGVMVRDLAEGKARAEAAGRANGLSRVALREYVVEHRYDGLHAIAAERVRNGSLRELTETLWPYHSKVAERHGLELIMYEGGTHATAGRDVVEDEELVAYLIAFNYSDEMADLYREAIAAWGRLTESPFNAFVDVAGPSKWGSWGALRHLDDKNPRWEALRSIAAN